MDRPTTHRLLSAQRIFAWLAATCCSPTFTIDRSEATPESGALGTLTLVDPILATTDGARNTSGRQYGEARAQVV